MWSRLLGAVGEAGKASYRTVGKTIVALRLWNCQIEIDRLEARRRRIDLQSRSVILKRVHLNQLASRRFAPSASLPQRGAVPVLVRSMGRVVNG